MAMSAARCLANYKASRTLPSPTNDPAVAAAQGDALIQAIFQAWIDEVHANAAVSVTTIGSATTQTCTTGTIA